MLRKILSALHIQSPSTMLSAGDTAPEFELHDHLDRTVRLSDFRGRSVVLWFYPKADTPG